MAIIKQVSRRFLSELGLGTVNFSTDDFKIILMNDTFTFDPVLHDSYADVSANELTGGNGYTQADKLLVVDVAWAEHGTDVKALISWENALWTAASGNIGPSGSAIVYDDTHANDIVAGCVTYEAPITIEDGLSFELRDLGFELELKT